MKLYDIPVLQRKPNQAEEIPIRAGITVAQPYKLELAEQEKVTRNFLSQAPRNQRFKHYSLYRFWLRSEGLWISKLVKITVRLLRKEELLALAHIHQLDKAEFGIKLSWEYNTKEELWHMSWCVDAARPGLVFTDKFLSNDSLPQLLNYQMIDDNTLVMTEGKYEEIFLLKGDNQRLRELRNEGKLLRRLWEYKFVP